MIIFVDFVKVILPIIIAVVAVILMVLCFVFAYKITRKKHAKRDDDNFELLIDGLGGKGNILQVINSRSRLTVKLANPNEIDRGKLTEAGVVSVISMSEKISLVFNEDTSKTAQKFQNLL